MFFDFMASKVGGSWEKALDDRQEYFGGGELYFYKRGAA